MTEKRNNMDHIRMINDLRLELTAEAKQKEALFEQGAALLEELLSWRHVATIAELRQLQNDLNAAGYLLSLLCKDNAKVGQN